jgi:MSHA pilin protein MshC
MLPHGHRDKGFTLIEVISVLIIIAIIAAVAISRISSTNTFSVTSEAASLKTHLRFAQIKALGDVSPNTWGIQVSGNSYQLFNNAAAANINLPAETSNTHTFSGGVTATPVTITFDNFGNPGPADISVTLTSGSQTAAVTVTNTTGFIQ